MTATAQARAQADRTADPDPSRATTGIARALRVLSCYSGAGGLDLGLHAAGLVTIGCLETDPHARATLAAAGYGWPVLDIGDVADAGIALKPADFGMSPGELDMIAGGPPCQPFSKAAQWAHNSRPGITDPRADSLSGMLQLVESFLPSVVLIENVPGFARGSFSAQHLLQTGLAQINVRHGTRYRLNVFELDAANYGVAQHRVRAIVIACRDGQAPAPPPPTHADQPVRAWDVVSRLPAEQDLPAMRGKWADLLPCIPEGMNYLYLTARGGGPELFGYRTRYWSFLLKLAKDRPSWTVPASPGPGAGPFHWDNRPLTVAERLALQGLPYHWPVQGHPDVQVRLAGNATPPPLAEAVARALIEQGIIPRPSDYPSTPRLGAKRRRTVPPPTPVVGLPDRYKGLVGSKPAHAGTGLGPGAQRRRARP
jgi:DNA (cytosine-5)-methyltransferase 1